MSRHATICRPSCLLILGVLGASLPSAAHASAQPPNDAAVAEATPSPAAAPESAPAGEGPASTVAEPEPEPPLEPPAEVSEPEPIVADASDSPESEPQPEPEPEPEPAPTVEAEVAAEAPATEAEDRKSGAHLRPTRESALLKKHEVDASNAYYKPGNGLTFESKDGRFALATRLRAQFRYTLNRDGESGDTSHGVQIRRARLQFKGHFWNEHNKFKTEFAFSPRDMGLRDGSTARTPILDWYLDFTYLRDLSFRIGQYKLPYSRQRVVSSGDLQLVDRSIANSEFTVDRDIGFDFHSKDLFGLGHLKYHAGVFMGEGRDQYQTDTFEMLYLARIEILPFGMFNDYKEADFERSLVPRTSLGIGYVYLDGAKRNRGVIGSVPSDGGTTDYHNVTADLMFKFAGFSVFGDVFYRQGQRKFGDATMEDEMGVETPAEREAARTGVGWNAQAGYLLPRTSFELAGRYAQTRAVKEDSGVANRDEAGGGPSYYFGGHPLKLQLDYFARWLDGDYVRAGHEVRLQLQAAF